MLIREEIEKREVVLLSPLGQPAIKSEGRETYEEPDPIRTCFMVDRDRIIHSKSFRRLKHKTQVFIAPPGDHYRTRLTHTLEVNQIARTIGAGLNLNLDLIKDVSKNSSNSVFLLLILTTSKYSSFVPIVLHTNIAISLKVKSRRILSKSFHQVCGFLVEFLYHNFHVYQKILQQSHFQDLDYL